MARKSTKPEKISIQQIIQALLDDNRPFPPRYLYKLSDIDQADLPALQQAWAKISLTRKRALMEDLEDFSESDETLEFFDLGLLALTDPDAQVRQVAVRVLGDYQHESLLPEFLRMLSADPAVEVRAAAATALGAFVYLGEVEELSQEDQARVEDALLAAHQGNDALQVRRRALEALGFSTRPEVSLLIEAAYQASETDWQVSALFAMGRSYDEKWAPHVLAMLDDKRTAVRAEAASAAGELELPKAKKRLFKLLADPEEDVRAAAIWSLSQIGGDDVQEKLQSMLDKSEDDDEADLLEQALENLEFNMSMNFEFMDLDEDLGKFDEDDFLSGYSGNGRKN